LCFVYKKTEAARVIPDAIFFAQSGDDVVMDPIPMAEILLIRGMNSDEEQPESKQGNELMIETHPDGYNSGRTYYLQAESEALCKKLIKNFSTYATAAYERAQTQSTFALAQRRVDRVYRSGPFQFVFAVLITAVRFLIV
jgi:hypothetical protein